MATSLQTCVRTTIEFNFPGYASPETCFCLSGTSDAFGLTLAPATAGPANAAFSYLKAQTGIKTEAQFYVGTVIKSAVVKGVFGKRRAYFIRAELLELRYGNV